MEIEFLDRVQEASGVWSYRFGRPAGFKYEAGDYVELALPGIDRRWLTLASAPSEPHLQFTTRLSQSHFKQALHQLKASDRAVISPALGSFNLPDNDSHPMIWIASGLGITPYRSFIVEMDLQKIRFKSDLNLIYTSVKEMFLFEEIIKKSNLNFQPLKRQASLADIQAVPSWSDSIIYLAGAQNLCEQLYDELLELGLPRHQLKLCYFPGYTA